MKLKFLGATGTVTGSKYLVEVDGFRVLVDSGMFQGPKELRLRNWSDFPVPPKSINAVVLTHAHIDHSGYLPALMNQGFSGPIYCTTGTLDLCKILLPDAGKLQEEDTKYANRKRYSKHQPALSLFTKEDAERVLQQFKAFEFEKEFELKTGVTVRFTPSCHILGSAFVTLKGAGKSIVFSGDLGRPKDTIMREPKVLTQADYLLIESTYGNRKHDKKDPIDQFEEVINRATRRQGAIIVPAFSVGRAQSLLWAIHVLKEQKRIENIPVYLNSPMSVSAVGLYCDHRGEHRLTPEQCHAMCNVAKYVHTPEESKTLNNKKGPMVIISASGMATGGRVLHHLKAFAPDPKNVILFAGFQAAGTRGDLLVKGAKTIKIHGEIVPVNAEVDVLDGFSAHADQEEIMAWLKNFSPAPKMTFITHGEPSSAAGLQDRISKDLNWPTRVPEYLEEVELK